MQQRTSSDDYRARYHALRKIFSSYFEYLVGDVCRSAGANDTAAINSIRPKMVSVLHDVIIGMQKIFVYQSAWQHNSQKYAMCSFIASTHDLIGSDAFQTKVQATRKTGPPKSCCSIRVSSKNIMR